MLVCIEILMIKCSISKCSYGSKKYVYLYVYGSVYVYIYIFMYT